MNWLHVFYATAVGTVIFNLASVFTANKYVVLLQKLFTSTFAASAAIWMYVLVYYMDYNNHQIEQVLMYLIQRNGVPS
jgi:hypothetical protein